MTEVVGEAVINIRTNDATVPGQTARVAGKEGKAAGGAYRGAFLGSLKGLAAATAGIFAGRKIVDFFKSSVEEARESQKVSAATAAIIKATGGAANVSAGHVDKLTNAISRKVGIDDEAIAKGSNLILTFKNIRNEAGKNNAVFDRATQAAVDLSATGFTSITGASKLLGKALDNPVKGMSALSRITGQLDQATQDQIKSMVASGDTLGAQKVLLDAVEGKVGGVAAKTATAGEKFNVAFGNLKEQVGTALLPIIDKVEKALTEHVIPAISTFLDQLKTGEGLGGTVADVFGKLGDILQLLGDHINIVKGAVIGLVAAWAAYRLIMVGVNIASAISLLTLKLHTEGTIENTIASKIAAGASKVWAGAQWLLNAALDANPIGLIVIAIAAFIAVVILAYKHSATFRKIVNAAFNGAKNVVLAVVHAITGAIGAAWSWITSRTAALGHAFGAAWDGIKAGAGKVVDFIKGIPGRLGDLAGKFGSAGKNLIHAFVDGMKNAAGIITGIAGNVWDAVKGLLNGAIDKINAALEFSINAGPIHVSINPPDIPRLAAGTTSWRGGLALVGEQGPELAAFPRGTRVIPARQTAAMTQGIDYERLAETLVTALLRAGLATPIIIRSEHPEEVARNLLDGLAASVG